MRGLESNKKNLQYAIYTILNGEYTKFEEPEYSDKKNVKRYDAPIDIIEKIMCA